MVSQIGFFGFDVTQEEVEISVTKLPFRFPGHIFAGPMPFGLYDPQGKVLAEFKGKEVSVIVLLAEDKECLEKAKRDLRNLYREDGFKVIHLPIPDFGVPSQADLALAIQTTIRHARAGHNIAIHCSAGFGRTGMFVACLAKQVLGFSGQKAIDWVRQYIPEAVETPEQYHLVLDDGA